MLTTGSDNDMRPAGRLIVAGLASIGAGAIHATAAGNHSEHRQAVIAFVAVAVVQLSWGVLAMGGRSPYWHGSASSARSRPYAAGRWPDFVQAIDEGDA